MSRRVGRRAAPGSRSTARGGGSGLEASGGDGFYVVHAAGEVPAPLEDAAATLREGPLAAAGRATVLVGAGFDDTDALCERLAPALEECRDAGTTLLRLVMSGGAADLPGRPSPARRICEEWGLEVVAPGGVAVVVPDGTLFAPMSPDGGGWWHFSPGLLPRRLGTRYPAPSWQGALDRVVFDAAVGCTVEPVPGGLLVHPAGAPREGVDAVRYALPADPAGPVILVGTAGTAPVPADALADVVAALPAPVRGAVRLVPGDGRDLLATGQEVADLLGIEVQVLNGVPILFDDANYVAVPPRVVLTDADGTPSWRPYVEVVTCVPMAAPRLTLWRAPIGGLRPDKEPGAMELDRKWQVTVTWGGMWVGPHGARIPASLARRPVEPGVMTIDLGLSGRLLDDTLWEPLDRLFTALEDDVREHTTVQVQGDCGPETLRTLRRLTMRHGLALAPRGWTTSAPAGSTVPTASAAPGTPAPAAAHPTPASAPRMGAPTPTPVVASASAGSPAATVPAVPGQTSPTAPAGHAPAAPRSTALTASGAVAPAVPGRTAPAAPAREATPVSSASHPAVATETENTENEGADSRAGAVPVPPEPAAPPPASAVTSPGPSPAPSAPESGVSVSRPGSADPGTATSGPWATAFGTPVPTPTTGGALAPAAVPGEAPSPVGLPASGAAPGEPWRPEAVASSRPTASGPDISPVRPAGSGFAGEVSAGPSAGMSPVRPAGSGAMPAESARSEAGAPAPAAGASRIPAKSAGEPIGAAPIRQADRGAEEGESSVRPAPVVPVTPPSAFEPSAAGSAGPSNPDSSNPDPSNEDPARNAAPPHPGTPSEAETEAAADPAAGPGPAGTAASTALEEGAVGAAEPGTTSPPPVPVTAAQTPPPVLGAPEPAPSGPAVVTWVPVEAGHRSDEAERDAVRVYLGGRWDHHSGAVSRALTRVPALRASDSPEEVAADLTALHAYLTAAEGDRWTHDALRASLEAGSGDLLPFLGCLASGLRRLPSYRGAAVRSASGALGEVAHLLLPGEELGEAVPVSAVALDKGYPSVPADHYLIWSMTGRRASSLATDVGLAPTAGGAQEEVLFAPGTRLRLLAVAERTGSTVMMLRELPESAPQSTTPGRLDDADNAVLKRLRTLADQPPAVSSGGTWPGRCAGTLAVRMAPEPHHT